MALSHAANSGRHALSERGNDLYETPDVAIEALLRVEPLPKTIWEPACGPGAIVSVLRRHGHEVYATDLIDYGCPDSTPRIDFLMEQTAPYFIGAVVTNPPFKLAAQFVGHALTIAPKVVMLLRLAFLESEGRRAVLDGGHLARVHVFRNRLPMMHRDGWTGPRSSSAVPFAWFVWERGHRGPTELRRLSWESSP